MELFLETFALADLIDEVQAVGRAAGRQERATRSRVARSDDLGTMYADLTKLRQMPAQPAQQRLQVHRARARSPRRGARAGPRADRDWLVFSVARHRHRHDARADRPALPGLHPGRRLDHAQVRRHGAGPGDHPAALPHDGRRRHASTSAPGQGSTFTLRIPAALVTPPAEKPIPLAVRGPVAAARPARVLIIDDDPMVHDLMTRLLALEGFTVANALSGQDGLRLAREIHPAPSPST